MLTCSPTLTTNPTTVKLTKNADEEQQNLKSLFFPSCFLGVKRYCNLRDPVQTITRTTSFGSPSLRSLSAFIKDWNHSLQFCPFVDRIVAFSMSYDWLLLMSAQCRTKLKHPERILMCNEFDSTSSNLLHASAKLLVLLSRSPPRLNSKLQRK